MRIPWRAWGAALIAACSGCTTGDAALPSGDPRLPDTPPVAAPASPDRRHAYNPPGASSPPPPGGAVFPPESVVAPVLPAARQEELRLLEAQLAEVKDLDAAGLAARHPVPFATGLGYDPLAAKGLDLIQSSSLALDEKERAALAARGFAITDRTRQPSFAYGYSTIYGQEAGTVPLRRHAYNPGGLHGEDAALRRGG